MANLNLTDVGKAYAGNVEVLKNINLDIDTGELIVFVGPSGCGKSTLLRMIAGLEKINDGLEPLIGHQFFAGFVWMVAVIGVQIGVETGELIDKNNG